MSNIVSDNAVPSLVRQSDGRVWKLHDRLITIGGSLQSRIIITGDNIPDHLAHIMFTGGNYTISVINRTPPVYYNEKQILKPVILSDGDSVKIRDDVFVFTSKFTKADGLQEERTSLRQFISAISRFSRTGDSDARFELLAGIAQLLCSDGARLVIEESPQKFVTIARFPQSSGLDRFSQRVIDWAKEQGKTVLMHDTEWEGSGNSKGSLEINKIGSVLCHPITENESVQGYLYLDRHQNRDLFTENDRLLLEDVGPIFADLLTLYERTSRQQETIARLQKNLELNDLPVIFECEPMHKAINLAAKFAPTDATVLIQGETGTGKELFARFIHMHSNRASGEFCAINCGALPDNLIEAELFGHEKGAFTGAHQKKKGLFERAQGGTVFLDEIGEIPLNLQVKLLRVLQESEIAPLGSTASVKVDVRVIAATNRDLSLEVEKGTFRQDLFYRLNVLAITIPPLRNRHRDVLLLADFFIKKYTTRFGMQEKGLSIPAQALLLKYPFPGNIRQLENVVQKALLISKGNLITDADLDIPQYALSAGTIETVSDSVHGEIMTLKDARVLAEKKCIRNALVRAQGNVTIAARLLDTDRKWVTKLMKLYGIDSTSRNEVP